MKPHVSFSWECELRIPGAELYTSPASDYHILGANLGLFIAGTD